MHSYAGLSSMSSSLVNDKTLRSFRSYRDRKDIYTKSLEQELARARATEASLIGISQSLRDTIQALVRLLSRYGIEPPDELWCNDNLDDKEFLDGDKSPVNCIDYGTRKVSASASQSNLASGDVEKSIRT